MATPTKLSDLQTYVGGLGEYTAEDIARQQMLSEQMDRAQRKILESMRYQTLFIDRDMEVAKISLGSPELDRANAENADLKSQLAEHKEIIQALAAELGDMEALREENERLKSEKSFVVTPVMQTGKIIASDGWVEWHGSTSSPIGPGDIADIKVKNIDGSIDIRPRIKSANEWRWEHLSYCGNIIAYRIVG